MKNPSIKWLSVALAFVPGLITLIIFATGARILSSTASIIVNLAAFLWLGVTIVHYRRERTLSAAKLFAFLMIVLPGPVVLSYIWLMQHLLIR
jgi:hypothetical protein